MIKPLMKPKSRKSKPTRTTKDGRLILSDNDWKKKRKELWDKQEGLCAGAIIRGEHRPCGRFVPPGPGWHAAHIKSRGMGSGTREDGIDKETGMPNVRGICWECHQKETEAADGWRTGRVDR